MSSTYYYFNTITGEFPLTEADIKAIHPAWNSSKTVPNPFVQILAPVQPKTEDYDSFEYVMSKPQLRSGKWTSSWSIRSLNPTEVLNKKRKAVRNKVLNNEFLSPEEASLLIAADHFPQAQELITNEFVTNPFAFQRPRKPQTGNDQTKEKSQGAQEPGA